MAKLTADVRRDIVAFCGLHDIVYCLRGVSAAWLAASEEFATHFVRQTINTHETLDTAEWIQAAAPWIRALTPARMFKGRAQTAVGEHLCIKLIRALPAHVACSLAMAVDGAKFRGRLASNTARATVREITLRGEGKDTTETCGRSVSGFLESFPSLVSLKISGVRNGLGHLLQPIGRAVPQLTALALVKTRSPRFSYLRQPTTVFPPTLRSLELALTLTVDLTTLLMNCPNLTQLSFQNGTEISDTTMHAIEELRDLKTLRVVNGVWSQLKPFPMRLVRSRSVTELDFAGFINLDVDGLLSLLRRDEAPVENWELLQNARGATLPRLAVLRLDRVGTVSCDSVAALCAVARARVGVLRDIGLQGTQLTADEIAAVQTAVDFG